MPSFVDKAGSTWKVELDAMLIEEVEQDHGIDLTDLDNDPLIQLRNKPRVLYAVMLVICRDQREAASLTREQFLKLLPSPPDAMLTAMREAIIGFFPSGRASHVDEVLTKYEQMSLKTDELATAKMSRVLADPLTMKRLEGVADQEFDKAMKDLFPGAAEPGTKPTTGIA